VIIVGYIETRSDHRSSEWALVGTTCSSPAGSGRGFKLTGRRSDNLSVVVTGDGDLVLKPAGPRSKSLALKRRGISSVEVVVKLIC
jgi:hypothetical protein